MSSPDADPPEPAWIRLEEASRKYRSSKAIEVEALALQRSDVVQIIGANGAGKSTLLRLLAGYSRASAGKVHRSGAFKRAGLAFLPQSGGLYGNLTVLQNIEIMARLNGRRIAGDDRLVRPAFDLGVAPHMNKRVSELSGGTQRLVAIAAVFAAEPDAVFLDEPLASLDGDARERVLGLLERAADGRMLIVFTTHEDIGRDWISIDIETRASAPASVRAHSMRGV